MSSIMDILYIPLGWLLNALYGLFGNYLVALLIFAVIMKLILFPLSIKQQKNSQKQAKLRPKEAAIRKKYAGRTDKATQTKVQEEVLALYQSEGFNPASGCLPMIIQLPILLAVFRVVTQPLTYILRIGKESITAIQTVANTLLDKKEMLEINWIKIIIANRDNPEVVKTFNGIGEVSLDELEKFHDNFNFFNSGINLLDQPQLKLNWLLLIPILTFAIVYLSMKLTRKFTYQPTQGTGSDAATATSMKLMDLMMPLMSVWFSFMYPAAIGIYWMMQNFLGFVQQYILYRIFPIPQVTDEEMKAAELALRGKAERKALEKEFKESFSEQRKLPAKTAYGKQKEQKNKAAVIKMSVLRKVRESKRIPIAKRKIK